MRIAAAVLALALLAPSSTAAGSASPRASGPSTALEAPPEPIPVGVWPLTPVPTVVEDFDPPTNPYGSGHRGVDLLGAPGDPVVAALPGTVSFASPLAGRGVVVIDHGDTRTTYEPVAASVVVGDVVGAGDRIGALTLPGSHCFPRACLHWGWREGETYLDPLRLVGAGPVRLLPLWRDLPSRHSPAVPASRLPHPYAVLDLW